MAIKYMGGNYAVVGDGKYFGGSSLLTCVEGKNGFFSIAPKIVPKSRGGKLKVNRTTGFCEPVVSLNECLPQSVILRKENSSEPKPRKFTFNRKAIYTRALLFSDLQQSRDFLAFYTISFPAGTDDTKCRQALHTLLVRLKESFNLRGYVIVCERQQNGTLHFHMLVNDFMPVRYSDKDDPDYQRDSVNSFLQRTLYNLGIYETIGKRDSNGNLVDGDARKFNGVDVELIRKNGAYIPSKYEKKKGCKKDTKSRVLGYLIKYISKGEQVEWDFRPWRCSHSVSCLFSSAYLDHCTTNLQDVQIEYNMWATVYRWAKSTKQPALQVAYSNLCRLNSTIYDIIGHIDQQGKVAEFIFDSHRRNEMFFRLDEKGILQHFGGSIEFSDDEYLGEQMFDTTSLIDDYMTDFDPDWDVAINCPF